MSNKKAVKWHVSFWNTKQPVASNRVKVILRDTSDSEKLAKAIRTLRHKSSANKGAVKFDVSEKTRAAISDL